MSLKDKNELSVQNQPTFHEHRHNRGAVSHFWKGPGFYIFDPSQRMVKIHEFQNEQKDDLKLYRSNHWCRYFPSETQLEHIHDPMNLEWPKHSVFYSSHHNKWLNENSDTLIPRDARLFYNEEDWLKYKYMVQNVKHLKNVELIKPKLHKSMDQLNDKVI